MKKPHVFDLTQTEADVCWLQAGRLKEAADAGDQEAAKELERMQNTKLVKMKIKPKEGEK
jgi:hypothetical protein